MATANDSQDLALPRPTRLTLRNFTLYKRRRTIDVRFDEEVFCLAGANGLGKSTFLAALSYAMTGAVAKPRVNFLGAADYYKDVRDYALEYFDGRVGDEDHEIAEVDLEMSIGDWRIELTRGMFNPLQLRRLIVHGPNGVADFSSSEVSDTERQERYVEAVLEATGLTDFSQLVFLQLVVLTFDEQRRLMFWSPRVTEQALFLAFGMSAELAGKAEALQRTYDSAESRARNLQWQATSRRRRLEALESVLEEGDDADDGNAIQEQHRELDGALVEAGEKLRHAQDRRRDAELRIDDFASRLALAQASYDEVYQERLGSARVADFHPAVTASLEHSQCVVCGADGEAITEAIQASLDDQHCPLCTSHLQVASGDENETRARLSAIAEEISELESSLESSRDDVERRTVVVREIEDSLRRLGDDLESFREANSQALLRATGEEGLIDDAIRGLTNEISDLLDQKSGEIARRDDAQRGLNSLRDELTQRFSEMESDFAPVLSELAQEFLGVPLQVDLQRRGSDLDLSVRFDGSERRTADDLSESQRFFMDIALRMALAKKLAGPGQPAPLYVDTPEGSLDIAYEMRAGRMFGRFATDPNGDRNHIVMTANINTSRLLQELAKSCGREHMQLVRMTDWTDLTHVQQEAADAFEEAYADIEEKLDAKTQ